MINKRILHLSDLHGVLKTLWKVVHSGQAFDWIVLTGDIAPTHVKYMTIDPKTGNRIIDREAEAKHQLEWATNALKPLLDRIPHKALIILNGNHDFCNYGEVFSGDRTFTIFKGAASFELDGVKVERIGLPDKFIEHGTQELLRSMFDLDVEGMLRRIRRPMRCSIALS